MAVMVVSGAISFVTLILSGYWRWYDRMQRISKRAGRIAYAAACVFVLVALPSIFLFFHYGIKELEQEAHSQPGITSGVH